MMATQNGYPNAMLFPTPTTRKQRQTDTVEDKKRIVQMDEMLSEKNDPK